MQLNIGETYAGKYRVVRILGEGAMGAVYEAENVRIHRRVAIKVLHPQIAQKVDVLRRFEREAQAAGRIGSAHIVEVLDLGELANGGRFMVMEYLEGTSLDQRIRSRGRLTPEEATPIVSQLLEGLGAAHAAEIIHRDLKPANVFLVTGKPEGDFVKIVDFGVSKFNVLNEEMSMTSTGAVLGTPYYMSPEQAKGSRQVDPRSDLYAVGVILYECITGQVPFSAETFNELIFRIVLESPPPVESFVPNLDPAFTAIIHKAMARDANERFQTAGEFREALAQWLARPLAPVGPGLAAGGTMMMDQAPQIPASLEAARASLPAWAPRPAPGAPTQPLPAYGAQPDYGVPPGGGTGVPVEIENPYAQPRRSNGALAFAGGLVAVLVIGGGAVAAIQWKLGRNAAAAAAMTAPPASATTTAAPVIPPPPPVVTAPPPPVVPPPATVAAKPPEPVAAVKATSGGAPRNPGVATPKGTGKAAAPPGTATPGKRVVSGEL